MMLSEYLKPALTVVFVAVLGVGWYAFEHRSHPKEEETPGTAEVVVTKATNSCFSDLVRVTGFIVPRREAVVGVDQEGSKVSELLVQEGQMVTDNQELARLTWPPAPPGAQGGGPRPTSLRAPAPGLLTKVNTIAGAPASPQAGPMFRIAVNNEIDMDAEVPVIHMMKLKPKVTARISRDNGPDVVGLVRLISPQVDRNTQLGHVRVTLSDNPSFKIGMFAQASIDARRSCEGVAIPRTAIDHLTVQVVKANTVETRRVRVGLVSDNNIQILEGLDIGEIVVADAGSSLHDGDQIKTVFAEDLDRIRVR
jgi:multidrug efflux pump subunit AcrA (membrane-fusion protein)